MPDTATERFFRVVLSGDQLAALDAAAHTCADQWDGEQPEDVAEQLALDGAITALRFAEEVK